MKLIKMFGLAMVAAVAAMAFVGAGTASASEVCKVNENPCAAGNRYGAGQAVKAQLVGGTKATLKALGTTIECEESTITGEITKNPGETVNGVQEQAEGLIKAATWTKCNRGCTVTAVQLNWRAHINQGTGGSGTMWAGPETPAKEDGTRTSAPGASFSGTFCPANGCTFHAHEFQEGNSTKYQREWVALEVTGGNPAKAKANQVQLIGNGGLCTSSEGNWTAEYEVIEPKPLFII